MLKGMASAKLLAYASGQHTTHGSAKHDGKYVCSNHACEDSSRSALAPMLPIVVRFPEPARQANASIDTGLKCLNVFEASVVFNFSVTLKTESFVCILRIALCSGV